jgi:hypothetical protein
MMPISTADSQPPLRNLHAIIAWPSGDSFREITKYIKKGALNGNSYRN